MYIDTYTRMTFVYAYKCTSCLFLDLDYMHVHTYAYAYGCDICSLAVATTKRLPLVEWQIAGEKFDANSNPGI